MYPILYYESGDTNGCDANEPESFIYDSFIRIQGIGAILGYDDLTDDDEFLTNEWVYLDED